VVSKGCFVRTHLDAQALVVLVVVEAVQHALWQRVWQVVAHEAARLIRPAACNVAQGVAATSHDQQWHLVPVGAGRTGGRMGGSGGVGVGGAAAPPIRVTAIPLPAHSCCCSHQSDSHSPASTLTWPGIPHNLSGPAGSD
jgi:hypothetical protein